MKKTGKSRKVKKPVKRKSNLTPVKEFKISEAILNLSDSLRKKYRTIPQTEGIISITIMAWNLSLFPDEEQENVQGTLIENLPEQMRGEDIGVLLENIDNLIEKKKKIYPSIRDYILDYNLSILGSDITLTIGSAPIGEKIIERSREK